MPLVLNYTARSDRGLVRSNNEDSVYAGPRLLALADGMGGHAAGEVASKVVIAALAPLDEHEPGEDLLGPLRDGIAEGNAAIAELVTSDADLEGMGTTLTAILFAGTRLGLAQVGDSRGYLRRDGVFAQITKDDTFVQSLIDEGRITPAEARIHPQRSLVLKALTGHAVEPTLAVREARAGDRYLICSDGLSDMVTFEALAELMEMPDPQECVDRMIEMALKGGGTDNVTVIRADVIDVEERAPQSEATLALPQPSKPQMEPVHPSRPAMEPVGLPQPSRPQETAPIERPRRNGLRTLLITCGIVVVLGGLAALGWWYLQTH
ncbi:hypothetical protein HUW46_02225 [Amycolatopsis sp. CA-230715]|nr:hypothetical protein HUW46_02225 [Amycolatopsis sp. CA-230715]